MPRSSSSSSSPTGGSAALMGSPSTSSPEPSLRQALGESSLQNKPFSRPLTKRQSQKFGCQTPSKGGSFTPRSTRFHPASRPSTPSSTHARSPGGSSPVPELDPFEKARVNKAWVEVQFKALSRCPPDVNLLSPSSTSPKLLTLHQDLTTWTAWLDACELKMENLQVVELPRMVASAKGPPPNVDIYDVILTILPLLKTLRTRLLARRSWLELLGLSLEWGKMRNGLEKAIERGEGGGGVWGFSPALSDLASIAHKSTLLVKSSVELRALLSDEEVQVLVTEVPKERDAIWWALRAGRDASWFSSFSQPHQFKATYNDLIFPPSSSSFTSTSTSTSTFRPSTSIPILSPYGTSSSSLNENKSTPSPSTSTSTASSLQSLSPSSSSSTSSAHLQLADHTGNTLPRILGWMGTEEQKRSWWEISRLASSKANHH